MISLVTGTSWWWLAALLITAPALITFVAVLMALVALTFLSVVVWLADTFWWRID
jgi:hypothetical protein